jgi:tetratricopeptide (TPR) repeat protein
MAKKKKPAKRHSAPRGPASKQLGIPSTPSRSLTEQTLRDIHRVLGNRKFKNVDEMNALLKTLLGPGLKKALQDVPPLTAKEEAQNLAYRAMDAEDENEAASFAKQALERDPDCVDALLIAAELNAQSPDELIAGLERAVQAGERSLGATFFKEKKGHFWGILETRPYMRARELLAEALYADGQVSKAIKHYEALLELNPNDNQGIRDLLLGAYLGEDNLKGSQRLLQEYGDDATAVFAWGRTLGALSLRRLRWRLQSSSASPPGEPPCRALPHCQ